MLGLARDIIRRDCPMTAAEQHVRRLAQ